MFNLEWDKLEERKYTTGVDHVVLFLQAEDGSYPEAEAWSGVTQIVENPSGGEPTPQYADNIKYFNMISAEELGATIECFYYPDGFKKCNGIVDPVQGMSFGQQARANFALAYRTKIGNAVKNNAYGYQIRILYGCSATPTDRTAATINESVEAPTMSFTLSTLPVTINTKKADGTEYSPTSVVVFDSTIMTAEQMEKVENILYGSNDTKGRLPLPDEFLELLADVEG